MNTFIMVIGFCIVIKMQIYLDEQRSEKINEIVGMLRVLADRHEILRETQQILEDSDKLLERLRKETK